MKLSRTAVTEFSECLLTSLCRIAALAIGFDNVSASLWIVMALALGGHYIKIQWFDWIRESFVRTPFYAQATVLFLLALAIQYVAATGAAPFIYTKF